jgi:hypothetical protein
MGAGVALLEAIRQIKRFRKEPGVIPLLLAF